MGHSEIADLIQKDINNLVRTWMDKVREDNRIISDSDLSDGGLRDHVPSVLAEICEVLSAGEEPGVHNTREGRVSAYTRFCQGYRARDIAAELSLLRMTLLDYLNEQLLSLNVDISLGNYMSAVRTINLYIDEELRYAFSIYTESHSPQPLLSVS
jgi:hypothetical protein